MDIRDEILKLKKEKGAIILAHYYQIPEIQEIADYVGDSYYLSKIAKDCEENIIVFCGVKFMAESAKILSPEKTVILPVMEAGCVMADMATEEGLAKLKEEHPNAKVVCYINSSTEVKALSDVCCTSSNAENIINNLEEKEIIFLPDRNLGSYIQEKTPDKKFILWNGFCIVHEAIQKEEILRLKNEHEGILTVAHPECSKEIRDISDFIGSTSEIINFVNNSSNKKFIIITEEGVLHQLRKNGEEKEFYIPYGKMVCRNMKMTTLKDLYESLLKMENKIEIDEDLRLKAYNSLKNMHKLGG
ncbi:quinolinate synthase NadA [Clostridium perfringens]|uniref:quinolinate synthase NadA n=1 Tax=Clostridium perfringens TaxID=1502 RepID=UPI001A2C3089|nr:quinolinate synthase NadA [Clostridium perfringens]ELC8386812.1 quinolinate synthase NadA [Clostridium perfringens]ELC8407822.1 quinolinate synthase NadA [Clostridium perfringens]MDC4244730.1 quinolinate synthase NadA [Clostridium perfringens]HAT4107575.1 quinolinate synthase NadA [Clostridium perfringens]HAT4357601.1 quinolinate synthase NadA [Clostridium perfringens]